MPEEYNPEELKKLLQNMGSTQPTPPVEKTEQGSSNPTDGIDDSDLEFATGKSIEELGVLREAWCEFQTKIKDLACVELLLNDIRRTGEALAQAELSFSDEATKCGGQKAAERIVTRSRIMAAVLNKYRTTKGE